MDLPAAAEERLLRVLLVLGPFVDAFRTTDGVSSERWFFDLLKKSFGLGPGRGGSGCDDRRETVKNASTGMFARRPGGSDLLRGPDWSFQAVRCVSQEMGRPSEKSLIETRQEDERNPHSENLLFNRNC